MRARPLTLLLALSWGCGGASTSGDGPGDAAATTARTPTEPDASGPWRFVPTLEQHLPAGAVGEPVLELSQPRQRTVVIVAAVLRAGAEHVELERWTFAQGPDGQSLERVDGGEPILRLRPGPKNPNLAVLRRELAAPGVVLTRPMGLPVDPPLALIEQLTLASLTVRDPQAEPRARVRAAATLMRGLDDTVVFERDAIGELAMLLAPPPHGRGPRPAEVERLGERRARVTLHEPAEGALGGTTVLELQRKSDGWAISSLERASAAPTPSGDSAG
jgi:hypothetical protein